MKFVHTNLVATNWKKLSHFYHKVFDCTPVPPERNLAGKWLDKATGLTNVSIRGVHLHLPGCGDSGPTLEIFQYGSKTSDVCRAPNTLGFAHIAFAVEDVAKTAQRILANGGPAVGELTRKQVPGVGLLSFQYLRDPEGNIIEIQKWHKSND